MATSHVFATADYVIFAITIAVSIAIGVYHAVSGGKQRSTQEFLVGNREMKAMPVTLSLIVSYESAIMMLGYPGDTYTYGIALWWSSLAWGVSLVIVGFLMVPTFFRLRVVSVYEYLQARFNSRVIRLMGSFLGVCVTSWYMGIVLYGPATALQAVTGLDMWYSIVLIAGAAMIYTTLGGIKGVIWSDAFQTFVMLAGILAVIIKGIIEVGGMSQFLEINRRGGRLEFFNFDPDPTTRHTFWGLTIGMLLGSMGVGTLQTSVQRIASMPTIKKAQLVTILSAPGFILFDTLACIEGLVAYAYFTSIKCDPLEAGFIDNPNQIMPYMVMELFSNQPGLAGLFLAGLFSASLSTLSSGYASLSAILWTDFIKPHMTEATEFRATLIAKAAVIVAAVMSIGIASLVANIGGTMNQIAGTLISSFAGPLAGIFFLAGLVPFANAKGAIAGMTVSAVFSIWKGLGSSFSPEVTKTPYLPASSIENCTVSNTTVFVSHYVVAPNTTLASSAWSPIALFYNISYQWIASMAIIIAMAVGSLVSWMTASKKDNDVDPHFLMPVCDRLCCCLPEKLRRVFRYMPQKTEEEPMHTICEDRILNAEQQPDIAINPTS